MSQSAGTTAPPSDYAISEKHIGLAWKTAGWPLGKQIALLKLCHTSISVPVADRLLRGTARASQKDYWDLMRERYSERQMIRGRDRMILTPAGRREADALAWAWAKELRLHLLKRGESRFDCNGYCSCGMTFASRKSPTGANNIQSQFGQHLEAVENRSWKPFDADAFMVKVTARFEADAQAREQQRRMTG